MVYVKKYTFKTSINKKWQRHFTIGNETLIPTLKVSKLYIYPTIRQKPSQMFHCIKWQHIFYSNIVPGSNDDTMKHNISWCSTGSTTLTCCV